MTKRERGMNEADWAFVDWLRANPGVWMRYAAAAVCGGAMIAFLALVELPDPPIPGWVETVLLVLAYAVTILGAFLAVVTRALVKRLDEIDDRGQ